MNWKALNLAIPVLICAFLIGFIGFVPATSATTHRNDFDLLHSAYQGDESGHVAKEDRTTSCQTSTVVSDTTSLDAAIECFNLSSSGNFSISFNNSITSNVVINNASAAHLTISGIGVQTLHGTNSFRPLTVVEGRVTIEDLVIKNGSSNDGGGINNNGRLIVFNSTVSNNSASRGGAIFNTGILTVSDSINCPPQFCRPVLQAKDGLALTAYR